MRAASVKEIKSELEGRPKSELIAFCLRLSKFKKESKELLTYLLFEEQDEHNYITGIKSELDDAFLEVNTKSIYIAKKNLRRILRRVNSYIRYSSEKTTEITLLIYYLSKVNESGLEIGKSQVLTNLYNSQVKKINTAIGTLHEDLQYDYRRELEQLDLN